MFSSTAEALLTARKTVSTSTQYRPAAEWGLETAADVVPMLIPGARSH